MEKKGKPGAVKLEGLFNSHTFETLPKFKEVPQSQRIELFKAKLRLCRQTFDFRDPQNEEGSSKDCEAKKNTLLELVDYLNVNSAVFCRPVLAELMKTVQANIFRALGRSSPAANKTTTLDPDEDEPNLEEAWPHYQVVYELLLRFVMTHEIDAADIREALSESFILNLLELFNSEDPRERDYLKTLLHRIYGRFMPLRDFIRESVMNFFIKISQELEENNGISELLEILSAIIHGFQTPLKDQHVFFLQNGLLPLHKVANLASFHSQLQNCVVQFLEKDTSLGSRVIGFLLKIWPITNAAKEVLFLTELEEMVELQPALPLRPVQKDLFTRLCSSCVVSNHFQVAERTLYLLNNDNVVKVVTESKAELFPIIL